MFWSSGVTIVESLQVIGLQDRVNVESLKSWRFSYDIFCCEMAPDMLKMAPDKLEYGVQHATKWRPIS